MNNDKDQAILLAELMIKTNAISNLLIKSKVFTEDQLSEEMKSISQKLVEIIALNTKGFGKQ